MDTYFVCNSHQSQRSEREWLKKTCLCLVCGICLLLLGGCWDSTNIEDRGFIIGVAIDMADGSERTSKGNFEVSLTNQLVIPAGDSPAQQEGTGSKQEAYKNITGTGDSIFTISHQLDTRTSKQPYYEHIKVVLVSEEVVKHKQLFSSIMDIFLRDPEMRRNIKVVITKGKAKKYLSFNAGEGNQLPAIYINQILENTLQSKRTIKPVRLGKVHEFLLGNDSFAIPVASMAENSIDFSGVAVFHGYNNTFVGMLDPAETMGLNLTTGSVEGGGVEFKISDRLMSFEIQDSRGKVKVDTSNSDKVKLQVKITVEGRIDEMFGDKRLLREGYIDAMEKRISEKIKTLVERSITKSQKRIEC
ncbi:Ger(x)C family spore germination protein [Virgibacillus halophilus]|uniref:Ger(X)C family spore germination protein n=1 Tax=Tigheibacillus halophilus TaxID=361280 RepID=A0ABU5C8C5_9BACI|nr:Ger(x)C family spore germination protein [Virgibacillus halophilus]